jgi:glucokinase
MVGLEGGRPWVDERRTYRNDALSGVADGVRRFLGELGGRAVDRACIAVAGPVEGGEAHLTNRGWTVREGELAELLRIPRVRVINDFEALGHSLAFLGEADRLAIQEGIRNAKGPMLLLGAGTGLGQAVVVPRAAELGVDVLATEGGHATFAARTEEEWALQRHLAARHGHVSWERVLSGSGLHAVYRFLVETGRCEEDRATAAAMSLQDPAAVVTARGAEDLDPCCRRALDIFMACYGARAGDAALAAGATGGVSIAGGIAPRIATVLVERSDFLDAFLDKGRLEPWLRTVPVHVVMRRDAALLGAAVAAVDVR